MKAKAVALLGAKDVELKAIEAELARVREQAHAAPPPDGTPAPPPPLATPAMADPLPTPPTLPPGEAPTPGPTPGARGGGVERVDLRAPGAVDHLKLVFKRYVEMGDAENEALFRVLATMLDYSGKERRAMQAAREQRVARRSSLWGFG